MFNTLKLKIIKINHNNNNIATKKKFLKTGEPENKSTLQIWYIHWTVFKLSAGRGIIVHLELINFFFLSWHMSCKILAVDCLRAWNSGWDRWRVTLSPFSNFNSTSTWNKFVMFFWCYLDVWGNYLASLLLYVNNYIEQQSYDILLALT